MTTNFNFDEGMKALKDKLDGKRRLESQGIDLSNQISRLQKEIDSLRVQIADAMMGEDRDLAYVVGSKHPGLERKKSP